jgi:hypothetical protein
MSTELTCRYCGAQIRAAGPGERTPTSAWTAPDEEDPAACTGPGHAPQPARPVVLVAKHNESGHETRTMIPPDAAAAMPAEVERLNTTPDGVGYTYRLEDVGDE